MEVTRVTAIRLPDGTRIDVSTEEGSYHADSKEGKWKTMRVCRAGQQRAARKRARGDPRGAGGGTPGIPLHGAEL